MAGLEHKPTWATWVVTRGQFEAKCSCKQWAAAGPSASNLDNNLRMHLTARGVPCDDGGDHEVGLAKLRRLVNGS